MYSSGSSEPKASSRRNGSRRCCRSCVRMRVSRTPAPSDVARPATCRSTSRERRIVGDGSWLVIADLLSVSSRFGSKDADCFIEREPWISSVQSGPVTVAEVHQEVRLEPAVGKELPVDLLVVEPRHRT